MSKLSAQTFWRAHLRLLAGCLLIWFLVSFGCGILFAEALNAYSIGNVPLGFWFAQQGAIYVFLLIIVFYTWRIGRLERRLLAEQMDAEAESSASQEERR